MKKVLLVGEPLVLLISKHICDLSESQYFYKKIAGAELNVCVGLTRLGFHTEYFTRVGNDPFGESIKNFLKNENIGNKYFEEYIGEKTGVQFKAKTDKGDPEVLYYRDNTAASKISPNEIDEIDVSEFDLIHITGIPLAVSESFRNAILELVKKAKEQNKLITFDPNLRLTMWKDKELMRKVINEVAIMSDYFMPGIGECEYLIGEKDIEKIKEKYLEIGVKKLIIKDGEKGSYYIDKEKTIFESSFIVKKVIDTVGAGDGFAVGIISSILERQTINNMLIRGNAIGAIQVTNPSDNEGLPIRAELDYFISNTERKIQK